GEPDAGNPPVRFGGRGDAIQCVVPTPIEIATVLKPLDPGFRRGDDFNLFSCLRSATRGMRLSRRSRKSKINLHKAKLNLHNP
ncbi:MAG: hypothetical protein JW893_08610, partial [Candidatus Omnitrophica bacterium]|nr:hypothetical protein [Candidatus Omnitrophota bacterium]